MERLVRIAKKLRLEENFNGYIHLKSIPGASDELMHEAGLYADRLSVNVEIPTVSGLKLLAPEKDHKDFIRPMGTVKQEIARYREERRTIKSAPTFAPAGQSTQLIIGATGESDMEVMYSADYYYKKFKLRRVYYSGYIPVSNDERLPGPETQVPLLRENRLYQTDWLLRFYGFQLPEILSAANPNLEMDVDPKLSWALRNLGHFPVDVNRAEREWLLRVPGLGVKSANKIVQARKFRKLNWEHLKKIGVALNRAKYFLVCDSREWVRSDLNASSIKGRILQNSSGKFRRSYSNQLDLFSAS